MRCTDRITLDTRRLIKRAMSKSNTYSSITLHVLDIYSDINIMLPKLPVARVAMNLLKPKQLHLLQESRHINVNYDGR